MENNPESHEIFHSFCVNPNVRFESQHTDEKVVLLLRAHPITQLNWVINTFFLVILVVLLNLLAPLILFPNQILFFNIFSVALIFAYVWYNFLLWYFNVGIVTNERIVDVDFHTILYKEVTIARVERVEEVTSKAAGYIGSLFDYGDVYVETASNEVNIEFKQVPHPSRVVQIVNELHGS